MRKLFSALLFVTLCHTTVKGTVIVECTDLGGGTGEIIYDASSEYPNLVRAFALDITVNSGATIEEVFDYKVGVSTAEDPGYGIFPGSGSTPVGDPCDSDDTLPGLGTYGITIEMASLYDGDENAPLFADSLFKFSIDWHGALQVNVSIALNAARGGIVMEDVTQPPVNLIGCTLIPEPATLLLLALGAAALRKRK